MADSYPDTTPPPPGLLARVRQLAAQRARWEREHPDEAHAQREAEREAYFQEVRERAQTGAGRAEVLHRMGRLGVPEILLHGLARAIETPALKAAKDFHVHGTKPFCLLLGETGRGKSVAAAWLLAKFLQANQGHHGPSGGNPPDVAMWVSAPEFDGVTDWKPEHVLWVERCCRARFLVLDDLGIERAGENAPALGQVLRVLSARHGAKRRTVVTSNLSHADMAARYEKRLWSRLQECADFRVATGPDLRTGKP